MKYQIAFVALAAAAAAAAIAAPRPVTIAAPPEADVAVCASGEVQGLNQRRDNYLSVRAGPGVRERELDRLRSGTVVLICDEADNGWFGVVYARRGNQDCLIGQTDMRRRPYRGPCRSGWVSRRYIRVHNAG